MTFNKWLEEVRKQMKEQNIDPDSVEIYYIDTHMPEIELVELGANTEIGLIIT